MLVLFGIDLHSEVWCLVPENALKHFTIAINFIQEAATYDRHSVQIKQNIAGITRGAKVMKEHGAINGRLRNQIIRRLDAATYDDFLPLIYVIDTRKVAARIIPVPPDEAARPDTPEYKILDLRDDEYTVIDLAEIVSITRSFPSRRVDFAGL